MLEVRKLSEQLSAAERSVAEIRANTRARSRMSRALASFDPSLPRVGRVERQLKRAFIAHNYQPLTMSQLWPWAYPGLKRAKHWHRWSVRCALLKIAKPVGRSATGRGRPGIWALSDGDKPITDCP